MSNRAFAEYATGIAFSVQLSKTQCHILLRVRRNEPWDQYTFHGYLAHALARRGLLKWTGKKKATTNLAFPAKLWQLTKAGESTCALLDEAGIKLINTETPIVKNCIRFWNRGDELKRIVPSSAKPAAKEQAA